MYPFIPHRQQRGPRPPDCRRQIRLGYAVLRGVIGRRARHIKDVGALKVAPLGNAVVAHHQIGVSPQQGAQFGRRPHEKLALHALAVGILRRVESAGRVGHFPQRIVQRLLGNAAVEGVGGNLPGVQVQAGQQGVVVQHLFKVRHQPVAIGGIAVKAAANLVVDAAVRHLVQGQFHHFQGAGVEAVAVVAQQELRRHRLGELGGAAETAVEVVKLGRQLGIRLMHHLGSQRGKAAGALEGRLPGAPHLLGQLASNPFNFALVGAVSLAGGGQQTGEAGHSAPILRRKVGAAVVGAAFRREEHRHRPAAAAGHHLHRLHINGVQVGAFLPVNLDVDEMFVHQGGDGVVFKGFPFHHMAPVARGVADAQQDGLVRGARLRQGGGVPGLPVHRIVGVLQQVGAGFVNQSVGHRSYALPENLVQSLWRCPSIPDAGPRRRHACSQRRKRFQSGG